MGEFEMRKLQKKAPTATQYAEIIDNFRDRVIEDLPVSVVLVACYDGERGNNVMINFAGRSDGVMRAIEGLFHLERDRPSDEGVEDADN